jgi:hypothetical protein
MWNTHGWLEICPDDKWPGSVHTSPALKYFCNSRYSFLLPEPSILIYKVTALGKRELPWFCVAHMSRHLVRKGIENLWWWRRVDFSWKDLLCMEVAAWGWGMQGTNDTREYFFSDCNYSCSQAPCGHPYFSTENVPFRHPNWELANKSHQHVVISDCSLFLLISFPVTLEKCFHLS